MGKRPDLRHSLHSYRRKGNKTSATCTAHTKSGKSKWLVNKLHTHGTSKGTISLSGGAASLANPFDNTGVSQVPELNQAFSKTLDDISGIISQPGGLLHMTVHELLQVFDDMINMVVDVAETVVEDTVGILAFAAEQMVKLLNRELDIPFISELYELITGDKLTILDLLCLIISVPIHIVAAVLGIDTKEAENALTKHPAFPVNTDADAAGMASGAGAFMEISFIVFSITKGVFCAIGDYQQGEMNLLTPEDGQSSETEQPLSKAVVSVLGQFSAFGAGLLQWGVRRKINGGWHSPITYMAVVPSGLHLGMGIYSLVNRKKGNTAESFGRLEGDFLEKHKFTRKLKGMPMSLLISFIGLATMADSIANLIEDEKKKKGASVIGENIVDLVSSVSMTLQFLNWSVVCKASEVDGIPISSLALSMVDGRQVGHILEEIL